MLAVTFQVFKCEKAAAGVIEDTVDDDFHANLVAVLHVSLEIFIRSEPVIHGAIVDGVVAVAAGLKEGTDVDRGAADALRVVAPFSYFIEMRALLSVIIVRAAAEAERINVIEYGAVIPCHIVDLLWLYLRKSAVFSIPYIGLRCKNPLSFAL